MKKILTSISYMIRRPIQAVRIFNLYKLLKGRYRLTIILAHSYREAFYAKKNQSENSKAEKKIRENKTVNQSQIIINIHDGLLHSGGLTDRLKGICTLYMFAKKNNFRFKIYFVHPFKLEKYLLPNIYDWIIDSHLISYNLDTTSIYTWETEEMAHDFFKINTAKEQLHIGCNSGECFDNYSELFHELFTPSLLLATELDYHTKKLGGSGNYISISFRFQNLLGEFEEANSTSLTKENRTLLIDKCLKVISKIKEQHQDVTTVLITSDSNTFREIATSTYPYVYTYVIPEEVGHMDYAEAGKAKELTAFLDMFLIAGATKAYQVRNSEMYNSDFPNMAAKINNVPYDMILIK